MRLFSFISALVIASAASADLPQFSGSHYSGYFEVVKVPGGINWHNAKAAAEAKTYLGRKGHLATEAQGFEHDWMSAKLGDLTDLWLGGKKEPFALGVIPGTGWVTGEPFPGNSLGGNFKYLGGVPWDNVIPDAALLAGNVKGQWVEKSPGYLASGYIVEYSNVPTPIQLSVSYDVAPDEMFFLDWTQATVAFHNVGDDYARMIYDAWINRQSLKLVSPPVADGPLEVSIRIPRFLSRRVPVPQGPNPAPVQMDLIYGDINGDDIINTDDYLELSNAFDSVPGDLNWNHMADLNLDGVVATDDYLIISERFGMEGDNFGLIPS